MTGQHDAVTIQDGLHHLARREFIRPVRDSSGKGEAEYAFWHVLTATLPTPSFLGQPG